MAQEAQQPNAGFRIDDWTVDPATNTLSRTGKTVRLEPKVMDVLVYLAGRPGVVVSRGQLEDDVWQGLTLSYDTVTGAIGKLRKALEDDARNSHAIETISKKGYRLVAAVHPLEQQAEAAGLGLEDSARRKIGRRSAGVVTAGFLLVAIAAMALVWNGPRYDIEPAPVAATQTKAIAVLPFKNLSGDPGQEYFADGITEDLITDISKISSLFVIARNSSFAYKDQSVDVRDVARELGVRYVLEGSVRRSGDRVRINAQLIDASTAGHLWAERYDGAITDVFALQDNVTRQIVSSLAITLTPEEETGLSQSAGADPESYDLYLQGQSRVNIYSPEANAEARDFFHRAVAIDPSFSRAHAGLALTHAVDITFGWSKDDARAREQAMKYARAALALDSRAPQVHFTQAMIYGSERRIDAGIEELRRAVALDPNYADGYVTMGLFLSYAGKPEEGITAIRKGMQLSPRHGYIYPYTLANAYFVMQRYDEAVPIVEDVLARNRNFQQGRLLLIAMYGLLDRVDDAEWEMAEVLTALPDFSVAAEASRVRFTRPEDRARYAEGLRKAGLPE